MVRVFLISDYQLLRQGLMTLLQSQPTRVSLIGTSAHLGTATLPWGNDAPDVVLLDLATDPQQTLPCLRQWRAQNGPKVLLLCRHETADLVEQAVLAGARGVIQHDCAPDLLLVAIEKVQQGQIWLDRDATARLISSLASKAEAPNAGPSLVDSLTMANLTLREQAIVTAMLHHGNEPARKIAERLHISESTLRNHLTSIYEKLGVNSRVGLVALTMQNHLTELGAS